MTRSPTVHRLLWGPTPERHLHEWRVRAWETPAVGLPVRIAVALFFSAIQRDDCPEGWTPSEGPLTWAIERGEDLLSAGRQRQFAPRIASPEVGAVEAHVMSELVSRSLAWEVDPHPAYFLPFAAEHPDMVDCGMYALYCDILLLLTTLDGGEAILSRLADNGASAMAFEDRWDWRSRVHLPKEAWQTVECAFRWTEAPASGPASVRSRLIEALEQWKPGSIGIRSFAHERVDILVPAPDALGNDLEIVRTVRDTGSLDGELPEDLLLDPTGVQSELRVRIGQVERWSPRGGVVDGFPHVDSSATDQMMEQIAAAFLSPEPGNHGSSPELVILPEVSVPNPEATTVRGLVRKSGRGALAGLYWRVLPPVYPGASVPTTRWFVNEAELVLAVGYEDRGPTGIRWYRVRKPVPSHMEAGLARALQEEHGTRWCVLAGHRWYRFVHPRWGDFTIAICSDLLDATPWSSLRGELVHLFMVAFNRDVELFESLTWVRAYENYVNLVSVNHGSKGGSFVWTPRIAHKKEIAQLRGHPLFLLADVDVPVARMVEAQQNQADRTVSDAASQWLQRSGQTRDFKAPPPGYVRGAKLG